MHRVPMMRMQAGADAGEIDLATPARAPQVRWTVRSLAEHTAGFSQGSATADSARECRLSTRLEPGKESRPAIVCGVDDSDEARRALDAAVELARRLDVRPVIVRVGQAPMLRESEGAELVAWAADSNPPKDAEYKIVYGMPGESLVHAANEIAATLIVVGTRARGRIATAFRGSASADVIARSACPVLVVPSANARGVSESRPG
jgi:nucleotide-binding universal stress UspA family protein